MKNRDTSIRTKTKREEAAIAAMQGLLSNPLYDESDHKLIIKSSVQMADALFDELDGEGE